MRFGSYMFFLVGMILFVEGLIHIGDSTDLISNLGSIAILCIGAGISYTAFLPSRG